MEGRILEEFHQLLRIPLTMGWKIEICLHHLANFSTGSIPIDLTRNTMEHKPCHGFKFAEESNCITLMDYSL